ncbi:MAG: DUF402 domain-containing protein [Candidatus Nezhaarchaeales archaeon]
MLFRIRGIYSTALASMLMKRGHELTQPSKLIASRLAVAPLTLPPRVDIYDLPDKDGVMLEGEDEAINEALSVLEELPDSFIKEHAVRLNAVYKGVVEEASHGSYRVNLGGVRGLLRTPALQIKEGEEVLVTVIKPSAETPSLSLGVRVVGDYAKLIQGHGVSLSKGLAKSRRAKELITLGHVIKPQGWGIRWRRSAAFAPLSRLIEEIEHLKRKAEECIKRASERQAPALIMDGVRTVEVRFYGASLIKLDSARSVVCPTMPRHHTFKAWKGAYPTVVDLLESLYPVLSMEHLSQASDRLLSRALKPGSTVFIKHIKPQGAVLSLTPGKVVDVKGGLLKLERKFRAGGVYDGIKVAKEEGDRGLTVFKEGCWASYTAYFSKDGLLKGAYFNISTPPVIKPGEVCYIDLLVDVVWTPTEGVRVLDMDEVAAAAESGWLPRRLAVKAMEVAKRLADELVSSHPLSVDLSIFSETDA